MNVLITPTKEESRFALQLQEAVMKKIASLDKREVEAKLGISQISMKSLFQNKAWSINIAMRTAAAFGIKPKFSLDCSLED